MKQAEQPPADAVVMRGIAKAFGGVKAVERVDFSVRKGEIEGTQGRGRLAG